MRHNGRKPDELRPVEIVRGFTQTAPGSVLIRAGRTHVLCTASIADGVEPWREPSGAGWITAEYDMLPSATTQRRARNRTRVDGRTQEIQRIIGRALRAAVDMRLLGLRTIFIDCDVLQADGGTRTAAITGAYVALCDALAAGRQRGLWGDRLLHAAVAAVSVGVVQGTVLLDLDYDEDAAADVDCNLIMTDRDEWIEVQATAEGAPCGQDQLAALLALGRTGIHSLLARQRQALEQQPSPSR
jgi:ribonuclease PH